MKHWKKLLAKRYGCGAVLIMLLTVAVLLVLALAAYWALPGWVGRQLLPATASAAGLKGVTGQVRRIGLTGADLEKVRFELDGHRILDVDSLRVDYVLPWWPFRRELRISALALGGVRLRAVWRDGELRIPGLYPDLLRRSGAASSSAPETRSGAPSPLPETITLNRVTLLIDTGRSEFDLPLSGTVSLPDGNWRRARFNLDVRSGDDFLHGSGAVDEKGLALTFAFSGALHPNRYPGLIPGRAGERVYGRVAFSGRGSIGGLGGGPWRVAGDLTAAELRLGFPWGRLENAAGQPFLLRVELDGKQGKYAVSGLQFKGLLTAALEELNGAMTLAPAGMTATGAMKIRVKSGPVGKAGVLARDMVLQQRYTLDWSPARGGGWECSGETEHSPSVPGGMVTTGALRLELPQLRWRSQGRAVREKTGLGLTASASADVLPGVIGTVAGGKDKAPLRFEVGALRLAGTLCFGNPNGAMAAEAELGFAAMGIPALKLTSGAGSVKWRTATGKTDSGELSWRDVVWNGRPVGGLQMALNGRAGGWDLEGAVRQQVLPGADWPCRVRVDLKPYFNGVATMKVKPYQLSEPLQAGDYVPAAAGVRVGGKIGFGAEYRFGVGGNRGSADLQLREVEVIGKKLDLEAQGIDADVSLAALPSLRTPPLQPLHCRSLRFGTLHCRDIDAEYQLSGRGTLLLENFSLGWCGGKIYTHSLRLTPGNRNWRAILYCENIVLAQLLSELGIARAEGSGTIHGRIPVVFGADGVQLQPGFLYSVPGVPNQLKLAGLESLLGGLPPESPAYNQLDLAVEALKNYDYDWARLNFRTVGDSLRVEMKFDGRPNAPLPFSYQKREGQDILVRIQGRGANVQGIRLDVNTSVPLNQLLRINDHIKKLTGGKSP